MGGQKLRELGKTLSLVVVDEAHKAIAPTYKKAVRELSQGACTSLVGITATPGREAEEDSSNIELASFFGNKLVSPDLGENTIDSLRRLGVLASVEYVSIESGLSFDSGLSDDQEGNDENKER